VNVITYGFASASPGPPVTSTWWVGTQSYTRNPSSGPCTSPAVASNGITVNPAGNSSSTSRTLGR
jgi:hypothetical protein